MDSVPRDLRQLRACLLCSLVKSLEQFEDDGCDNCERVLHMKGDQDRVYECTSSNFDGLVMLCDPNDSWVAKWQNVQLKCRGAYAISVSGTLSNGVISDLRQQGVRYRPGQRDTATK